MFEYDYNYQWYPEDTTILFELQNAESIFYKNKKIGIGMSVPINYLNIPVAFDIEDTSFYDKDEKRSTMYVWQMGVNGHVVLGRTWEEFQELIYAMDNIAKEKNSRIIIYVHYLAHEFSFIRKMFPWDEVFCKEERDPIYVTWSNIEFRDSLVLTSKSLAKSAEDLVKYPIEKMVGDLDYSLKRGSTTPLTDKEIGYCAHDVLVLNGIIQEKIEAEGERGICGIPLTNTGYVRRYMREKCLGEYRKRTKEQNDYAKMIRNLTMTPADYEAYKRAFAGGFTHANALYVGRTVTGRIDSDDFTSSYPAVMLSEKFPMSKPSIYHGIKPELFAKFFKDPDRLMIFDCEIKGLRMADDVYENPISASKCWDVEGAAINNGRIVKAKTLKVELTDVDLSYILKFYKMDEIRIGECRVFAAEYLPKPIIESVLEFYKGKTELKGIADKVVEYMVKKGMLNSSYGCMVTDPLKDEVTYVSDIWGKDKVDVEKGIKQYNTSKKRFLYYPWGVFVTAYARRNLFTAIYELGKDYIYADTDSVKYVNRDKHVKYFTKYNKIVTMKIENVLNHYGIDPEESRPKTKKGVKKQIGVWDWETEESPYTKFKTLGAKRYLYLTDDGLHSTIAGLSKKSGREYIAKQEHPFDFFNDEMSIPKEYSGRMTHTYIDNETEGDFVDYTGKVQHYHEKSAVHLENSSFTLSMSRQFMEYLDNYKRGIREGFERVL